MDVNDAVYVNDGRREFESDSGISFPVIRKEYWERALNQAQQDHERKESIQQDVHGEHQNTLEYERQSHVATHCQFRAWCEICVKAKSPDGKHSQTSGNPEHILVIEFDCDLLGSQD